MAQKWPNSRAISLRTYPPWPERGSKRRLIAFAAKQMIAQTLPRENSWRLRYRTPITSAEALFDIFSNASGLVCGRYHGLCFALHARLPFLVVQGNTSKIEALLNDVGLSGRLVTLEELEQSDGPPSIYPFLESELDSISNHIEKAKAEAARMFAQIVRDSS
jgi:polysaccharide pyruvyl transferase WcaK-like protein